MNRLITVGIFTCCILAVTACSERTSVAAEYAPDADTASTVTTLPETTIRVDADKLGGVGAQQDDSSSEEPPSGQNNNDSSPSTDESGLQGVINLNEATLEDLMMLPGVGPAIAGRIADYRKQRKFEEPIDLKRVRGIGDKTFEKMAPYVRVSGETTLSD